MGLKELDSKLKQRGWSAHRRGSGLLRGGRCDPVTYRSGSFLVTRDMIFTFAVSVESSTAILEQLVVVSKLVVWFSCVVSLTIAMQQDNLSGPFEGKSISFWVRYGSSVPTIFSWLTRVPTNLLHFQEPIMIVAHLMGNAQDWVSGSSGQQQRAELSRDQQSWLAVWLEARSAEIFFRSVSELSPPQNWTYH